MMQPNALPRGSTAAGKHGQPGQGDIFGHPELNGILLPLGRDAEIYGEGEPAEYVYQVFSGAVRTYKILGDGRRQIIGFHLPGDTFGLDCDDRHSSSAEAISESQVILVRRAILLKVADSDLHVARSLWTWTAMELKRSQEHGLLLMKSARERLAAFLLGLGERLSANGEFMLPMSRQDIADHLGLTIETVSRTFTQFAGSSLIQMLQSRRIVLRNRALLSEMNA